MTRALEPDGKLVIVGAPKGGRFLGPVRRMQLVGTQHHLPDQLPHTWVESALGRSCPIDPELKARLGRGVPVSALKRRVFLRPAGAGLV